MNSKTEDNIDEIFYEKFVAEPQREAEARYKRVRNRILLLLVGVIGVYIIIASFG